MPLAFLDGADGTDEQDVAAGLNSLQRRASTGEITDEIRLHAVTPFVVRNVLDRFDGNTGIVDQDIEPSKLFVDRGENRGYAFRSRNVRRQALHIAALATGIGKGIFKFRRIASECQDTRALFGQQRQRGSADAGRAAGQQDALAVKVGLLNRHVSSSEGGEFGRSLRLHSATMVRPIDISELPSG